MTSIPAKCPTCKTDDGVWAYGRLIFTDDPAWPHCMICKGPLLPVNGKVRTSVVIDLTSLAQASNVPAKAYASPSARLVGDTLDGPVSGTAQPAGVGTAGTVLRKVGSS